MAEERHHQHPSESEAPVAGAVETQDRGLFDILGKKEEKKPEGGAIATEFEKVHVSEPEKKVEEHKEGEKKEGLLQKLHRSGSSSSSSSDEEEGEGGEKKKKKKKKGVKEKIKEKVSGEKEGEHDATAVPIEKVDEASHAEEKKGFLDKIKDKLPGPKKAEAASPPPAEHAAAEPAHGHEGEAKEKKGILEKIKEKIPGYHGKGEEEEKKEESH